MKLRTLVWLVIVGAAVGLGGCGDSGQSGPGDGTTPEGAPLDESKVKQTLPARKRPGE